MSYERLRSGDAIRLTKAMSVAGVRRGVIERVDGQDIYVRVRVRGEDVLAHRYACEMAKV